ncbi:hypothetical protein GGR57DRAFT_383562 [Xylariaceae sp. FL1272]|nr:hypothetical protein GGR57DRAFT_383562 [Xylariaceae sp. FL1272]
MSSPKTLVRNVGVALKLPRGALALQRRAINMPGFAVTVQDMLCVRRRGWQGQTGSCRRRTFPRCGLCYTPGQTTLIIHWLCHWE